LSRALCSKPVQKTLMRIGVQNSEVSQTRKDTNRKSQKFVSVQPSKPANYQGKSKEQQISYSTSRLVRSSKTSSERAEIRLPQSELFFVSQRTFFESFLQLLQVFQALEDFFWKIGDPVLIQKANCYQILSKRLKILQHLEISQSSENNFRKT
jgi:hypothetical protein